MLLLTKAKSQRTSIRIVACFVLCTTFIYSCSSTSDLYKSEKLSNNNFKNYKGYAFMPTNDTAYAKMIDRKPFEKMLGIAVKAQLNKRGMHLDTVNPDCLFTYTLKMNRNYEASQGQYMEYKPEVYEPAFDNQARIYTFSSDNKPVVYAGSLSIDTLREGSMLIDMIDIKENKVIWRSTAEGKRPETYQQPSQATVDKIVKTMFKSFPK